MHHLPESKDTRDNYPTNFEPLLEFVTHHIGHGDKWVSSTFFPFFFQRFISPLSPFPFPTYVHNSREFSCSSDPSRLHCFFRSIFRWRNNNDSIFFCCPDATITNLLYDLSINMIFNRNVFSDALLFLIFNHLKMYYVSCFRGKMLSIGLELGSLCPKMISAWILILAEFITGE